MTHIIQQSKIITFFMDFINENCSHEVIQKCATKEFQNELMTLVMGTQKKEDEMSEPYQSSSSWGWLFGGARPPPQQTATDRDVTTDKLSPELWEQIWATREEILQETEEKLLQQRTELECQMMERITSLEEQLKGNSEYAQFATSDAGEWADMKVERMIVERERKERSFADKLAVGDWVYYKRINEYVEIIEIHKEDPEENYYTLLLPDGKERQTNISNLGIL